MNNNTTQRNQNASSYSRGGQGCQVYQNGVRCGETKTLTIIQEFKQLYEDKMRIIDQEGSGDCGVQAKINLQQDWIRDLTEQNEMLVRAVEELEQEATERVLSLEEKLKQSSKCACETIKLLEEKEKKIHELERQIENFSNQPNDSHDSAKDNQISTLKQSMLDMRDALTAEVADKHDTIVMLRRDVQVLEDQCRKADQQTHFKDDIIKELRKEVKQLKIGSYKTSPDYLSLIDIKSFSDASIQTTYISTNKLISNLTKKCEEIKKNLELDVTPKKVKGNIFEKQLKDTDSTTSCTQLYEKPTTSRYVHIITRDIYTNTENLHYVKKSCQVSTTTSKPLLPKLKVMCTNTEPFVSLSLKHASTNTKKSLIKLTLKEVSTNTVPVPCSKQKENSTNTECFEKVICSDTLKERDFCKPYISLLDAGSINGSTLSCVCNEDEKISRTKNINTQTDEKDLHFGKDKKGKGKTKNKKSKIPLPVYKIPHNNEGCNSMKPVQMKYKNLDDYDDNINRIIIKRGRPQLDILTTNTSSHSDTRITNYYCPGFFSYRPRKIKVPPPPLDNPLYKHQLNSKTYPSSSQEEESAKRKTDHYPIDTESISTNENSIEVSNTKLDGNYESYKNKAGTRNLNSMKYDQINNKYNVIKSNNYINKSNYDRNAQNTHNTENDRNIQSKNKETRNSCINKIRDDMKYEAHKCSDARRNIKKSDSPKQTGTNRNTSQQNTRTSDQTDTLYKSVIHNDKSNLKSDSSEEFFKFEARAYNTSSKEDLSIFESVNEDDESIDEFNKSQTESFFKNKNIKYSYALTSSQINFRTLQNKIEDEQIPRNISLFENENLEILLMNQHIVELIEEVFDKETQITDMHDLLSFSIKTLMMVLKSLNVLEKRTTKINVQDLKEKICSLEEENEDLRLVVKKTTEDLDTLDKLTKSYLIDKEKLQTCCQNYKDRISCLEREQDQERKSLQECCRQYQDQILCLDAQKLKILQDYQCCTEDYTLKERKYLEQYCELQEKQKSSADTILNLEIELSRINDNNQEHCCMIKTLELKVQELSAECCKPQTQSIAVACCQPQIQTQSIGVECCQPATQSVSIECFKPSTLSIATETDQCKKVNKCLNTAKCKFINQSTQSRVVKFEEKIDDYYDIQVVKAVPASFSSPSSTSGSEVKSKRVDLLEVTFTDLKENFGKFMERDYEVDEAKKRITELEEELQQAWREKEKEVECARSCREQEIINLKEVINSLMKSLDNERQRSENLQKAVDLYLNSISVLQESEEQLKKEISDQRVTIVNLQEALLAAKHSLDEHRQKSNQDCINMMQVIEKLRDENLILEVDLFYYFQDIEIYEMRVLKYQQLLRDLQGQCHKINGEVQSLENQKVQQTAFVDDLSEQLSECQDELRHLFNVLTEEQNLVENESVTLTNHIMTLQAEMCALSQKLAVTIQCLENERKNNNVLEYQLNIRDHESSCLTNEVYIMKEKLRQATNEIIAHQSKIITLQNKLQDYEKSITLLDEESEMCQNNIQYCFKNLKEVQLNLDKRNQEYDLLKIEYSKEAGIANNLRIELQESHGLYNDKLSKCQHTIKNLQAEIDNGNVMHLKEIEEYIQSLHNLQEKLKQAEIKYKNTEEELSFAHNKLLEASELEVKLRKDHVEMIKELNGKINAYMNEQERLISVINNLENSISKMNNEIGRKDDQIAALKINLATMQNTNVDEKQLCQQEICNLKNEINTLIQKQGSLKSENDKLQAQVSKYHTMISKNEEKGKLMVQELKQCLTELQTIQGDKEFLLQKNEQLAHEIQSLQDACQSKTESVVTLEMELNDTKCIRDTLCNESRNVINNVKVWLQEQRKINIELNNKIKQKNVLISQMNQEKIILRNKLKQMSSCGCSPSQGSGYPKSKTSPSTFSYRPHTPPISGPSWTSYGSTESASCSSDSEVDLTDIQAFGTPQVWIHRVESLTEKLQRKNLFWKSKMDEHDFVVSKDK